MEKPTIAQLESIIDEKNPGKVFINPDGSVFINPDGSFDVQGMSDQEIRARALECATKMWCAETEERTQGIPFMEFSKLFWGCVTEFEAYIRGDN